MFEIREEGYSLELKAVMLNINKGHNREFMKGCKTLQDYSEYTARVREYADYMNLEDAVERAITECIREGVLAEFLSRYRAEAKAMSLYEYDEERHMRQEREASREEGIKEGQYRINKLNSLLLAENRMEDFKRSVRDSEYQEQLLEEYEL